MPLGILIVALCGLLYWIGGRSWGNKMFRRIGVPVLLALYLAIKCKCWWIFLACGAGYGLTIPIGYGEPDESDPGSWLGRIFKVGWLIRGVYGSIVASVGAVGLVLGHFQGIVAYLAYIALNFAIGAILCYFKAPDWLIEPAVGAGIGSIVFFII